MPAPPCVRSDLHLSYPPTSIRKLTDQVNPKILCMGRYEDQGRVRPVVHRASLVEMAVPYGDVNEVRAGLRWTRCAVCLCGQHGQRCA